MHIISSPGKISKKQIKKLIELLPKEVRDLKGCIEIYNQKQKALEDLSGDLSEETLTLIEREEIQSTFYKNGKYIMIYNFVISKGEKAHFHFVLNLYHNIRLKYQIEHLPEKYLEENEKDTKHKTPHPNRWCELDAHYFSCRWILENKKKIKKIMQITYEFEEELQDSVERYEREQKRRNPHYQIEKIKEKNFVSRLFAKYKKKKETKKDMFRIMNFSNQIEKDQMNQLIELLEPDVKNIAGRIRVFENLEQVLQFQNHINLETMEKLKKGTLTGLYIPSIQEIMIFEFNLPKSKEKVDTVAFAFNLFHEIRHMYQEKYLEGQFYEDARKQNEISYKDQWIEIDANYHAIQWILQHKKRICEILNITYNNEEEWKQYSDQLYQQLQTIQMV